jgi:hypothetical protein
VADRPIARYGVAFGMQDTDHAIQTRHLLKEDLRKIEDEGRESTIGFVELTKRTFGFQ